jgi:ubiquinone/menaquinone biosynthesis C-methylase UbiE
MKGVGKMPRDIIEDVKSYYGKTLSSKADLKTAACCCSNDAVPAQIREVLSLIADEIFEKSYGCGSPLPPLPEGMTVLDIGCGTGRDVYTLSKLVGPHGRVIGVDMTDEQIQVARKYAEFHREKFGYEESNVEFHQGYMEDLASLGIADESIDIVISNCVINLSPAKDLVLGEIHRVLKPGGELYFADVFADRRIPDELQSDPVLRGECLSGAVYTEDFRRLMNRAGFADYRYTLSRAIALDNDEIEKLIGMIGFTSRTVRAFKIDSLEDICEDYGQIAYYMGTIPGYPHRFDLDDHHSFEKGRPMPVCGNTADMLTKTRFRKHFEVTGDRSVHYGPFDCSSGGKTASTAAAAPEAVGCAPGCC